jgi:dihydrodipicolinate synthase/N-acetylneuraminate lyase
MKFELNDVRDVWSAAPTPFTREGELDIPSVKRMVEHHLRLGVKGLFVGGTNGEGPWMTDSQKRLMVRSVVAAARGRLPVTVQVSDNSACRIVANMKAAREDGADAAIIAPPSFLLNATPENVRDLYLDAIRACPLPVGIYDRGKHSSVPVPLKVLKTVMQEKKVVMLKDSSGDPERRDLFVGIRKKRRDLRILNGSEFDCVTYIKAGYDGVLLGGGVFNGYLARLVIDAVRKGDLARAETLQKKMNRMMYAVYGGKKIACWLAGEKRLLVELGLFSTWHNLLRYPLTPACERAILRVARTDRALLLPE